MISIISDVHYLAEADFPVCCPPKDKELWRMHPRVYLPLKDQSEVTCPYCSARYILKSKAKAASRAHSPAVAVQE